VIAYIAEPSIRGGDSAGWTHWMCRAFLMLAEQTMFIPDVVGWGNDHPVVRALATPGEAWQVEAAADRIEFRGQLWVFARE
jgi:hypothetical protein